MNQRSVRRALAAGAFVVLAGGAVGACSLRDLGYLTSADGDDGGTKADGRTTDARSHADGSATESSVGKDARAAGHDAKAKIDATASHFCLAVDATFCEDFDEGAIAAGWTSVDHGGIDAGLGFLALYPDAWVSPPFSARIGANPLGNGGQVTTPSLTWSAPGTVHTLVVRMDLNVQAFSDNGSPVFYVSIGQPNVAVSFCSGLAEGCGDFQTQGSVGEEFDGDGACVSEAGQIYNPSGSCFIQYPINVVPAKGAWSTVEISLSVDSHQMTLTVDGVTSLAPTPLPAAAWTPGPPSVSIGIGYAKGQSPLQSALYDNVVINAN